MMVEDRKHLKVGKSRLGERDQWGDLGIGRQIMLVQAYLVLG